VSGVHAVDLADFCLDLFSSKARSTRCAAAGSCAQRARKVEERNGNSGATDRELDQELNGYVRTLHKRAEWATAFKAMSTVLLPRIRNSKAGCTGSRADRMTSAISAHAGVVSEAQATWQRTVTPFARHG